MGELRDPKQPTQQETRFEERISPEHLRMVSQASGGFRFVEDPSIPPNQTGFTNKETREIHYNPLLFKGSAELGIEPIEHPEGFFYHEALHHAPEVLLFDNDLVRAVSDPEIIPEAYRGSQEAEMRFFASLYSHFNNANVDMWLEAFGGRRPYLPIRNSISEFQRGKGEMDTYKNFPKPEQLMQALLRSRYFARSDIQDKLDPDVYEAYRRIRGGNDQKINAIDVLTNAGAFEYFPTKRGSENAIANKVRACKEIILPEYLKLLESELEKRKRERQTQKAGGQGGKPQEGGGQTSPESTPLTKEEEEELKERILEELRELGHEADAPSEEEKEEHARHTQALREHIEKLHQEKHGEGKAPEQGPKEERPPRSGEEALREVAQQIQRKEEERARQGLAEQMQVTQETIRKWREIKETYRMEIQSTASVLAEIFLDDRRRRLEYLKREGEVVPGLEYETIAAIISGDLDPETKIQTVRNPEFLETEIEFIVDTSGSMLGEKIRRSIELLIVATEALRLVKEDLAGENLLQTDEEPLRLGVTKFATLPERVTRLSEPLDDKKELTIIDKLSRVGGGTEESGALEEVYKELALHKKNIIKIVIALTDGAGNKEGVRPIMRQVEEDNEVVFLVVGLGGNPEEAKAIIETYLEPLRDRETGNIFGIVANNFQEVLPGVLEFLKREVGKRRQG